MLLNKKVLLMALVFMVATGCVNNQSKEQQAQIISLQSEVVTAQKGNLDAQQSNLDAQQELLETKAEFTSILTTVNDALSKSKTEVNELTEIGRAHV